MEAPTRRALFAAAGGAALGVAGVASATATPRPEKLDAAARAWLDEFIREGGKVVATGPAPGDQVWLGHGMEADDRAFAMLSEMSAGNPLRPRIGAWVRKYLAAGVL